MKDNAFLHFFRLPWLHSRSLDFLACSLVISIASVLLTNNVVLPERLLHWFVLPVLAVVLATRAAWLPLQPTAWLRSSVQQTSVVALVTVAYIAVLIIATAISDLDSPRPSQRLRHYLQFGSGIAVYVIACSHAAADPRRLRAMIMAIGVLVAIHGAMNIVLFLEARGVTAAGDYRLMATFGTPLYRNPTHIAPLAAMFGMALLALVANKQSRPIELRIAVTCVLVLVLTVLLSQARGALVALTACAFLIALISHRRWRVWMIGLSTAALAAIVLVSFARTNVFARADSFRIALAQSYLQLSAEKPWFGYGLDREVIVTINSSTFEQPHNAFVWAALRGGALAGFLAIAMILLAIYWSYRYWRLTRDGALLMLMLALGITAMTEIGFLVIPYNWIWLAFWLPIGLVAGAERAIRQTLLTAQSPSPLATPVEQISPTPR